MIAPPSNGSLMDRTELNARLPQVVTSLVDSITAESKLQHLDRVFLPSRDVIIDSIRLQQQLIFPGYFGRQGLTRETLPSRIGELALELAEPLFDQVRCCLRYREHLPGTNGDDP